MYDADAQYCVLHFILRSSGYIEWTYEWKCLLLTDEKVIDVSKCQTEAHKVLFSSYEDFE
jgi:hypothetical protein